MMQTHPHDCTEYKSLYPTDSANQEIAIPRLASSRNDGQRARPRPAGFIPDQVLAGSSQDFIPVQRIFQPRPAALEELLEVLHQLLLEVPCSDAGLGPEAPCFSVATE